MKYRVTHTSAYDYEDSVPLSHNLFRLTPRDTARQTVLKTALTVTPEPAARRDRVDFFGNHVTWVSLQEPHESLKIEAVSEVEVRPPTLAADAAGPPWEQVAEMLAKCETAELYPVKEYAFNSAQAAADPKLADYARPSFPPGRPLMQCLVDLTARMFKEFTFDPRATTVGTPVLDVLRDRRGVCQDFAHVQIGCLRSLGLAGRYVSGYVLTHPPPGRKRLVGCDASHAWAAAFVPAIGWVDFDPTNGVMPSTEHVTLAWGRDYDDISPVKGVLVGGHGHSMYYGVDVAPIDEPDAPKVDPKPAPTPSPTPA